MTRTTGRPRTWPRRLLAALAAAGLLGAALQAQAHLDRDRDALQSRVAAARAAIRQADGDAASNGAASADEHAQWFNWGNWNNWNNWPNWGNWNNWLNHR